MATGTSNPPGSDNPLDLRANAQNLDLLLLGPDASYPSRLGVQKRSWTGIDAAYDSAEANRDALFQAKLATTGYELPSIPYAAGISIVRETQLIERLGEFYRAKAGVVPFVTTGVWATDELNLVAVGDAVLRQELAAPGGSSLVNFIHSFLGSVPMTVQEVLRLGIDVRMAGALPAPFDSSTIFQALNATIASLGGGLIRIGSGLWYATEIPNDTGVYWDGAGKGVTILSQPNGSNKDIVISRDFDILKGIGPVRNAPHHYGMTNLTIDGNYLADYIGSSIGVDTTYNNTVGYGIKNIGTSFKFDIEIVNCPQVGFYSEAVDYSGYGREQDSQIHLTGRVFGKEEMVYRGPADCNWEHVIMGCGGWKATNAERNAALVMSDIYPGEVVDGIVSDEEDVPSTAFMYNGHHEATFIHSYGNRSGLGYRARNTGRLKITHLTTENNRGGVYLGPRVWGWVNVEAHNNQREPSALTGTIPSLPDIENASQQGLILTAVVRPAVTESPIKLALKDSSLNSKVTLSFFPVGGSPIPGSYVADLSGTSKFDITLQDVDQDAIVINSQGNTVTAWARDVTTGAVIRRIAGGTSINRSNDMEVHCLSNVANAFYLDGLVTNERLSFIGEVSGAIFMAAGSQPDMLTRSAVVEVSGRKAGAQVCSRDAIRSNLDTATTGAKTLTVAHTYFQIPDAGQISVSVYDPSPTFTGSLKADPVIQTITATDITFAYEVLTTGTSGPLVLVAQIH